MIGVVLAGFAVTILLPALAQPLFGSKQIYFYYKINAEVLVAGLAWFGLAAGIVTANTILNLDEFLTRN